jgi:hypothetical protein
MSGDNGPEKITVQDVQTVQVVQASSFILPRDAGEERGRGIERSVAIERLERFEHQI